MGCPWSAIVEALRLIAGLDAEVCTAAALSLGVSLAAVLLEILAMVISPSGRTLLYCGEALPWTPRAARPLAGEVKVALQPHFTFHGPVRRNVDYDLRVRRVPRRHAGELGERQLTALDLRGLAERDTREISGNEAQRVSLAGARTDHARRPHQPAQRPGDTRGGNP